MLHTVNKSPFSHSALQDCAHIAKEGSTILLIEDGVYGAQENGDIEPRVRVIIENHILCALGPDLEARGITRLIKGIKVISYDDFVDLVEQNKMTAWV